MATFILTLVTFILTFVTFILTLVTFILTLATFILTLATFSTKKVEITGLGPCYYSKNFSEECYRKRLIRIPILHSHSFLKTKLNFMQEAIYFSRFQNITYTRAQNYFAQTDWRLPIVLFILFYLLI